MGVAPEGGEIVRGTRDIGGEFQLEAIGVDKIQRAAIAVIDLAQGHAMRGQTLLEHLDGGGRWHTANGKWLAGAAYSLADIAYSPYLQRLRHLGFADRIEARPQVAAWAERPFETAGFRAGVAQWTNPDYVEIFDHKRSAARERINRIAQKKSA